MSTTIEPPVSGQDGDNRHPINALEPPMSECLTPILQSLKTMKDGDFSVRLPVSWTGLPGKIADNFNEIVTANEQMARELKTRRPGGGQRGQDPRADPRGAAPRRLGRHGSLGQYAGRRPAAADDRSDPRDRRRGAGQSDADCPARCGRPSPRRRIPALRQHREHHDSAARRLHR